MNIIVVLLCIMLTPSADAVTVYVNTGTSVLHPPAGVLVCPQTSTPIVYDLGTGSVFVDCTVIFAGGFE